MTDLIVFTQCARAGHGGLTLAESRASWIMASDENADCLRLVPGQYC